MNVIDINIKVPNGATPDDVAELIIKAFLDAGLQSEQMLKVIELAKAKIQYLKFKERTKNDGAPMMGMSY